jgi:prevent-host-death family protein
MLTKTIDLHEAQNHFTELLSLIMSGAEIILTDGSTPVARLVPAAPAFLPRIAGLHLGDVWTSDDFDEPLPETFWVENA